MLRLRLPHRVLLVTVVVVGIGAFVIAPSGAGSAINRNYAIHLSGDGEMPMRDTQAQGQAIFHLSKDGTTLDYKLTLANIENVFAAHIHLGAPDENGPVVAFLYGTVPVGGGRVQGVISQGTITAANLIGPLAGHPLADLIAAMDAGNTYVNAHTNDGVDPANTGAGDFPGGEVRGQIR